MHGSRINLIRPSELPDTPEPLKCGMVDDVPLPLIERDEPVDRATDFEYSFGISHDAP